MNKILALIAALAVGVSFYAYSVANNAMDELKEVKKQIEVIQDYHVRLDDYSGIWYENDYWDFEEDFPEFVKDYLNSNRKNDKSEEKTIYDEYNDEYYSPSDVIVHYDVDSSAISDMAYCYNDEMMLIVFRKSGDVYIYYDVPNNVWEEFCKADSLGNYFNKNIKNKYEFEQVEDDE